MLPVTLLVCVVGVGVALVSAMLIAAKSHLKASRQARMRAAVHATRVTAARRITAELAKQRAKFDQPAHPVRPVPPPDPLPVGELTTVIENLENSTRFARLPAPLPVPAIAPAASAVIARLIPPRRLPKGSAAPPPLPSREVSPANHRPSHPRTNVADINQLLRSPRRA